MVILTVVAMATMYIKVNTIAKHETYQEAQ